VNVKRFVFSYVATLIIGTIGLPRVAAQQMSNMARESAESMLQTIATDIKKHYYDPNFHGLDWDAIVAEAKQRIDKSASFDMAIVHIAAAIDALNDSHTVLLPPRTVINASHGYVRDWRALMRLTNVQHDYGWRHEMVGERCFVTQVHPGSDAEKKGLHVGDEILSMNGYHPGRATIQRADYVFNVLRPQPELRLEVIDPSGVKSQITVTARVQKVPIMSQYEQSARTIRAYEEVEHLFKPRIAELGDDLAIIKVPQFSLTVDAVQS
jgi:C-terminal processing protease CtpA/Prc